MIRLYNTLTRKKETFSSFKDKEARLYTCGPTVYDYAHIGNLRAYVFSDLLRRALETAGYKVKQIVNITDVGHLTGDRDMGEDKLEQAAAKQGRDAWQIASFYTDAFLSDLAKLNVKTASRYPKATDHIKEMVALIETLEKKGFTYQTSDGVYFDTSKVSDYGKLTGQKLEELKEGARVEKNPEKKNPTDFALWKFSPKEGKRQMEWKSPWGVGFPGWHIECSAMAAKFLGQPFDIHTGGIDHIPIHHTNEIAQSEAAAGKPLANLWIHSEFVIDKETRIGKSEGNLITLGDVIDKGFSPLAYRYFVLQGHYRSKLNFSWKALDSAQASLNNLYAAVMHAKQAKIGCAEYEEKFFEKIDDDLNTPEALAVMWEMLKSDYPPEAKLQSLIEMDKVLGLNIQAVWQELKKPLLDEVQKLVDEREQMRKTKNWSEADKLRDQIQKAGYQINDTDSGPLILKQM